MREVTLLINLEQWEALSKLFEENYGDGMGALIGQVDLNTGVMKFRALTKEEQKDYVSLANKHRRARGEDEIKDGDLLCIPCEDTHATP